MARPGGPRRITTEQWLALRPGMTLAEVERHFGFPGAPMGFDPDPVRPDRAIPLVDTNVTSARFPADLAFDPATTWRVWRGEDSFFIFRFRDGRLADQGGGVSARPGFFQRLRDRLGL